MIVTPTNRAPMEACPECSIIRAGHRDGPSLYLLPSCGRFTISACCPFSRKGAPITEKGKTESEATQEIRTWWLARRQEHPAKWKLEILDEEIAKGKAVLEGKAS